MFTVFVVPQDHPDDVAWTKHVYDFIAGRGNELQRSQVDDFLMCFYRRRPSGNTQSGFFLHSFPPNEKEFLEALFDGPPPRETLPFDVMLEALRAAQDHFAEPAAPVEYDSARTLRADKVKHTRCLLHPQQRYRNPIATSQEVGWDLYKEIAPEQPPAGTPFRLRTSATTQFADAVEKTTWGRSMGGEFSAYATRKLAAFGGIGMGV